MDNSDHVYHAIILTEEDQIIDINKNLDGNIDGNIDEKTIENTIENANENFNKKNKRNPKKTFCFISMGLLLTFLLCFFLIPRKPNIKLNNIVFSQTGDGYGTFELINNNYYQETWRNPDISLYWLPYDNQIVGEKCYSDNPCSKYINHNCAIKLGEFKNDDHYNTKKRSKKTKQIQVLSSTDQEVACITWMILNPYEGLNQRLATTGTIKVNNMMNNKKKSVSTQYYYY